MKRFCRWVVNGLAGLSLLLCLAIASLWVRSYWIRDYIRWSRASGGRVVFDGRTINSVKGDLYWVSDFQGGGSWNPSQVPGTTPRWSADRHMPSHLPPIHPHESLLNYLGFWYEQTQLPLATAPTVHQTVTGIPDWSMIVATIWLPTLAFRSYRKRRRLQLRSQRGQCLVCGYDLRATPDRCPECGTIPPK